MWVRALCALLRYESAFLTGLTGPGLKVFVRVAHPWVADNPPDAITWQWD